MCRPVAERQGRTGPPVEPEKFYDQIGARNRVAVVVEEVARGFKARRDTVRFASTRFQHVADDKIQCLT